MNIRHKLFLSLLISAPSVLLAAEGVLDTSFGTNGIASMPAESSANGSSIALQNDGKIVIAGSQYFGSHNNFVIARLLENGAPDLSFSNDGKTSMQVGFGHEVANDVLIQPDGKILAAGLASFGANDTDFVIARFNSNGSLDTSFGSGGVTVTKVSDGRDAIHAIALQPDGKILAVGYGLNGARDDFAIARYLANGVLDNDFGNFGIVLVGSAEFNEHANDVSILPSGRILIAGWGSYI